MRERLERAGYCRAVSLRLPDSPELGPDLRLAGKRVPTHAHPTPELMLVVDGAVDYGVGDRLAHCTPGTVLFLEEEVRHDHGYTSRARLRHVWFRLLPDHAYAGLICHGHFADGIASWSSILPLHETGVDVWSLWAKSKAEQDPYLVRLHLQTLFGGILARLIEEGGREPTASPAVLEGAIDAVRRRIEETGGYGTSLEEMARLAGYSKYYFCRAFRRRTGMAMQDIVEQSRVRKASTWLAEGRSLKEIGALLGFSGSASFSRWCRKHRDVIQKARQS